MKQLNIISQYYKFNNKIIIKIVKYIKEYLIKFIKYIKINKISLTIKLININLNFNSVIIVKNK